jgi:hypothetical protein
LLALLEVEEGMTANLPRLAHILEEDAIDVQIESKRSEIAEALEAKKEYILKDSKGRTFRITAADQE